MTSFDVQHGRNQTHPPIVLAESEMARAFDLFQPEHGQPEHGQPGHGQAESLAPVPETAAASLPLGGIAPTDREIASARALVLGWVAACGIALFAFLSQGPALTTREPDEASVTPVVKPEPAETASAAGDIHLTTPPPTPVKARAKKIASDPGADRPVAPVPQPQP